MELKEEVDEEERRGQGKVVMKMEVKEGGQRS